MKSIMQKIIIGILWIQVTMGNALAANPNLENYNKDYKPHVEILDRWRDNFLHKKAKPNPCQPFELCMRALSLYGAIVSGIYADNRLGRHLYWEIGSPEEFYEVLQLLKHHISEMNELIKWISRLNRLPKSIWKTLDLLHFYNSNIVVGLSKLFDLLNGYEGILEQSTAEILAQVVTLAIGFDEEVIRIASRPLVQYYDYSEAEENQISRVSKSIKQSYYRQQYLATLGVLSLKVKKWGDCSNLLQASFPALRSFMISGS